MNLSEVMSKISEIKQTIQEAKNPLKREFASIVAMMLPENGAKQVIVTAYTPYFNDGDVCEYGIQSVNGVITEDFDNYSEYYSYESEYNTDPSTETPVMPYDSCIGIRNFIRQNLTLFEELFGEGMFVFKSDGTFIEDLDFDHE